MIQLNVCGGELLPCPFCGGKADIREGKQLDRDNIVSGMIIGCYNDDCYMQPKGYPNNNIPVFSLNWNRRAQPDTVKPDEYYPKSYVSTLNLREPEAMDVAKISLECWRSLNHLSKLEVNACIDYLASRGLLRVKVAGTMKKGGY